MVDRRQSGPDVRLGRRGDIASLLFGCILAALSTPSAADSTLGISK